MDETQESKTTSTTCRGQNLEENCFKHAISINFDKCYPKAEDPAEPKTWEEMSKDWTCNEHGKVNYPKHLKREVKNNILDNIQISDVKLTVQYLEEWRMIFKMLRTSPYCEAVAPFAVASIG